MTQEVTPLRQVRAVYDDETITVYQAFNPAIAEAAITAGTFVAPFSRTRMTWIKPSFLWTMYRSGWATKENQERVVAVRMLRSGFEEALSLSCWSHFDDTQHTDRDSWRSALTASPVRVQWDPERTTDGTGLAHRSLQVGLGPGVIATYVEHWIVGISDVTEEAKMIQREQSTLPKERPYKLPPAIADHVGATG